MSNGPTRMTIDELLAHREWLTRLARRLVADHETADDIVQETWLAALRRPPRRLRRVRAWLATVARNVVRDRGRSEATRRRREELASGSERLPDTAELVARAELRRDLAKRVLGLPEPFRTTVLLRFDEDLAPHEIARRAGIPASTVRGRLRRGLDLLREDLDRARGGDRKGWMTALLPLAGLAGVRAAAVDGAVTAGGLIVGIKVKLILVAAVVLILAAVVSQVEFQPTNPDVRPEARTANAETPESAAHEDTEIPAVEIDPDAPAYTGRVLDTRRRPRAGAPVVLRLDMVVEFRTLSGQDGRFSLPHQDGPPGSWSVVEARDPADPRLHTIKIARRHPHNERDLRIGDLVLREGHALDIVVESKGRGVPGARVDVLSGSTVFESATTDAAGRVRLEGLSPGTRTVLARAGGLANCLRRVGLPRLQKTPLRIELCPPRTVEVEIVAAPDFRPVPGVFISAWNVWRAPTHGFAMPHYPPLVIEPTDANGRTRIDGLGRDPSLALGVAARGYARLTWDYGKKAWHPFYVKRVPIPTDRNQMRIVLPVARRVEWPVVGREVPVPPDGTQITWAEGRRQEIHIWLGVHGGRMEGERLVVEGAIPDRPLAAIVETPDGAIARIAIDRTSKVGAPITFTRPRTLVVVGRRDDGSPAADVPIWLVQRDDQRGDWRLGPEGRTDASGIARLEGQVAAKAEIKVQQLRTIEVGTVDLTAGDARVEVIVPWRGDLPGPERPVRFRFTLAGEKGLPSSYRISAERFRVEGEDPEEGLLHGTWAPRPGLSRVKVQVQSPDHVSVATLVDVETEEVVIDLQPAGRLLYRVLRQSDQRVFPRLFRWDGADWVPAPPSARTLPLEGPIPGEAYLCSRLPPDRYRVEDRRIGATSEEVVVQAGGPPAVLTLDTRPPGSIEGLIVGPEGADLRGAFLETTRADGETKEILVGDDGRFVVPLKQADEEMLLTVRHPLLRPDPETGHARVRGSREGLELALVSGGVATVALQIAEGSGPLARHRGIAQVLLLRKRTDRAPAARLAAMVTDVGNGRWLLRFTGYEPGTWTVWFDLSRTHAPIVLENAKLGTGDADLGTARVTRGSTLRARVQEPGRPRTPLLMFNVEALDGPPLTRAGATDKKTLAISGIGPGRYRVHGGLGGDWEDDTFPKDIDEEITFDGRSVVERVIVPGK
jgi:RNA polymerase sigma factor (sigma-70 family)